MQSTTVHIIGGGLAGCEAAWQVANRDCQVVLHEMKPHKFTPAHTSPDLAELVCSNSLRSNDLHSGVGLLKEEMRRLDSLLMAVAEATQVPAGKALAVDRDRFAAQVTAQLTAHPRVCIERQEVEDLQALVAAHPDSPVIVASGPLTSAGLVHSLNAITGGEYLSFYDAIAPIIAAESIDREVVYRASRYDDGPGDYLNCPLNRDEYGRFIEALRAADKVPLKSFEEPHYFEGCLPIEVMMERGDDTLRFGPMKPVGLPDPRTGYDPYAVVQLRQEDLAGNFYNMVGFQTKLTYPAQHQVFRMIPGLEAAEFTRLGSIHRNTFVCAPLVLTPTLQLRMAPQLLLAGQITGVEGYVESTAMGTLAGINAARLCQGLAPLTPPPETALGALIGHLINSEPKKFQPSNINFGLFPAITGKMPKKLRGQYRAEKALAAFEQWCNSSNLLSK